MKYPWWDKYFELRQRAFPDLGHDDLFLMFDKCLWFIEEHAAKAERDGWRPIHIMRPLHGLAWKWRKVPDPFITTMPHALYARHGNFAFAYTANVDGSVSRLIGTDRRRAILDFGLPEEINE